MSSDVSQAIENEWYIVRYSGETPEIAYHSAIYYLTRAKTGPLLRLGKEHVESLKQAAIARYTEIVLRDLQHANSSKSIYRGIRRSIINYDRFRSFCTRQQLEPWPVRNLAAGALRLFLDTEVEQLQRKMRSSIINCSYEELQAYALLLGVEPTGRYEVLKTHCRPSS